VFLYIKCLFCTSGDCVSVDVDVDVDVDMDVDSGDASSNGNILYEYTISSTGDK
jgi:hypothetical protein